eukprot:5932994-Amphidinium_carterae.1
MDLSDKAASDGKIKFVEDSSVTITDAKGENAARGAKRSVPSTGGTAEDDLRAYTSSVASNYDQEIVGDAPPSKKTQKGDEAIALL